MHLGVGEVWLSWPVLIVVVLVVVSCAGGSSGVEVSWSG